MTQKKEKLPKYGAKQYLNGMVIRMKNKRQVFTWNEELQTYIIDFYRHLDPEEVITGDVPSITVRRNKVIITSIRLSPEGMKMLYAGIHHTLNMNLPQESTTYTYDK